MTGICQKDMTETSRAANQNPKQSIKLVNEGDLVNCSKSSGMVCHGKNRYITLIQSRQEIFSHLKQDSFRAVNDYG